MPRRKAKRVVAKSRRRVSARPEIFRDKLDKKKTAAERAADFLTSAFGSVTFLMLNVGIFALWLLWNVGYITGLEPIDPFPFSFLTTAVSLEAIILSVIVLMSQKRAAKIAEAREEVDLQVDVQSERDTEAVIRMLEEIQKHLHIHSQESRPRVRVFDLEQVEEEVVEKMQHRK